MKYIKHSLLLLILSGSLIGDGWAIESSLPPCAEKSFFRDASKWNSCQATITWPSGAKYVGEWKDGKRHGQGITTWPSGAKYVGEWKDGQRYGRGIMTYPDGQIKEGIWEDNKFLYAQKINLKKASALADGRQVKQSASKPRLVAVEKPPAQLRPRQKRLLAEKRVKERRRLADRQKRREARKKTSLAANKSQVITTGQSEAIEQASVEQLEEERRKTEALEKKVAELEADKERREKLTAKDTEPPRIIITDQSVQFVSGIVSGRVMDNVDVIELWVDGEKVKIDDGAFSQKVGFIPPKGKEVKIVAVDSSGLKSEEVVQLQRDNAIQTEENARLENGIFHALFIAVNEYDDSQLDDLNDPIRDAKALKKILLSKYKFESENVGILSNPSRDEILDEFDRLDKSLGENDNLLIFYAGHGYWDKEIRQGYWLPRDAKEGSKGSWLSNSTIRDYVTGIGSKHTLLIADACFSGGIFKTRTAFRESVDPRVVEKIYKLKSRKAMTSGILEEVPDSSVFLKYLIKRLSENREPHFPSERLFSELRMAVINNSPVNQVPQYGEIREAGDEGGDFIFVRK